MRCSCWFAAFFAVGVFSHCAAAAEDYSVSFTGGPSFDGRYVSFADPASGNLMVRETATGAVRTLTTSAPKEFAYFSALSRDSGKAAYAWFNNEGFYDLRVVNTDGTGMKILY